MKQFNIKITDTDVYINDELREFALDMDKENKEDDLNKKALVALATEMGYEANFLFEEMGDRLNEMTNEIDDNQEQESTKDMKFTWTDTEDKELYNNGVTILWMAGRKVAIQKFVEALSYKLGRKCDFSYTGGRAHIDVFDDVKYHALEVINDDEFMSRFIVPYSQETSENGTYCEIVQRVGII